MEIEQLIKYSAIKNCSSNLLRQMKKQHPSPNVFWVIQDSIKWMLCTDLKLHTAGVHRPWLTATSFAFWEADSHNNSLDYLNGIPVQWVNSDLWPYYAVVGDHYERMAVGVNRNWETVSLHHTCQELDYHFYTWMK